VSLEGIFQTRGSRLSASHLTKGRPDLCWKNLRNSDETNQERRNRLLGDGDGVLGRFEKSYQNPKSGGVTDSGNSI